MTYYTEGKTEKDWIEFLYKYISEEKNMIISEDEIKNLYFSLKTQRFVILNSKPGMGKTELSKAFIEGFKKMFSEDTVKEIFIPIGKDFDKSDLLGYQGLDEKYYPSEFAKELFELDEHGIPPEKKDFKIYFVILDEMNLSNIDYYFNTILAAIENNQHIELPNKERVVLPENTFFIGTINSFTYENSRNPLSGSVKRRGNIINIKNPLDTIMEIEEEISRKNEFNLCIDKIINQSKSRFNQRNDFLNSFRTLNFIAVDNELLYKYTYDLVESLMYNEENKLTFGILQDILEYIIFSNFDDETKALDIQVVQKILPSLTGQISNLKDFEIFLNTYNLNESIEIFNKMKQEAQQNMGQIIPLC